MTLHGNYNIGEIPHLDRIPQEYFNKCIKIFNNIFTSNSLNYLYKHGGWRNRNTHHWDLLTIWNLLDLMAYLLLTLEPILHLWLGTFATDFVTCILNIINLYQSNRLCLLRLSRSWIYAPNYNYYLLSSLPWELATAIIVIKSLMKAYSHLCLHDLMYITDCVFIICKCQLWPIYERFTWIHSQLKERNTSDHNIRP